MSVADAQRAVHDILHLHQTERHDDVHARGTRFVHYTTAETAFKIIKGRQIWMRNAIAMNDYSEIQHGEACLEAAMASSSGVNMAALLNELYPGIIQEIRHHHNRTLNMIRTNTYITCVSEHHRAEDITGRLSMWRAYGADNGVALVINEKTLLGAENDLKAYSSPVSYSSAEQATEYLSRVVEKLVQEKEAVRECGYRFILGAVVTAFRFAVLSTKHPGFAEEQEWRIIYMPDIESSSLIEKELGVVGGVSQVIYKLPIRDLSRIERIIVGPTKLPKTIADAFVDLLKEGGITDAASKVFWSALPLRR